MIAAPGLRALFVWGLVIFVPLCFAGQRQAHYLLPMMPVAAISIGVVVADALAQDRFKKLRWTFGLLYYLTAAVCCFGGVAMLAGARMDRGFIQTSDLVIAGLASIAAAAPWVVLRKKGLAPAVVAFSGAIALIFLLLFAWWLPTLHADNHRTAAAAIRQKFGDGPYVLYGHDGSDPLLFNLRAVAPEIRKQEDLEQLFRNRPETIVIAQTKNKREPPPVPPDLQKHLELEVGDEGMVFRVYSRPGR